VILRLILYKSLLSRKCMSYWASNWWGFINSFWSFFFDLLLNIFLEIIRKRWNKHFVYLSPSIRFSFLFN